MTTPALLSVLLIDDDSDANYLHTLLLTKTMHAADRVFVAENGQVAIHKLTELCTPQTSACPQLILLDLNMPVMNGIEFMEAYALLPEPQQAAVVVMLTTSLNEQDQLRARQLPIADFLTKPLTKAKVTALLAKHFAA